MVWARLTSLEEGSRKHVIAAFQQQDGLGWVPGRRVVIVANRALVETAGHPTWSLQLGLHPDTLKMHISRINSVQPQGELAPRGQASLRDALPADALPPAHAGGQPRTHVPGTANHPQGGVTRPHVQAPAGHQQLPPPPPPEDTSPRPPQAVARVTRSRTRALQQQEGGEEVDQDATMT